MQLRKLSSSDLEHTVKAAKENYEGSRAQLKETLITPKVSFSFLQWFQSLTSGVNANAHTERC